MIGLDFELISQDPFDTPTLIINLDRRPDRWEKMFNQTQAAGMVDVQRYSGKDGYDVSVLKKGEIRPFSGWDLKTGNARFEHNKMYTVVCSLDQATGLYRSFSYFPSPGRKATAGELGCTCSHRGVWELALRQGLPYTIVLEDDIALKPNFLVNTQKAIAALPAEADMLYLHVLPIEWDRAFSAPTFSTSDDDLGTIQRFYGRPWGTQAYVVTLAGAQKLLNLTAFIHDHAIDDAIIRVRDKLSIFVTARDEVATSLESSQSEIHQMGRFN